MPHHIHIPKHLIGEFGKIKARYPERFPEKLLATMESLSDDPSLGAVQFWRGYNCFGIDIVNFMLYYDIVGNKVQLLGIGEVFLTW